MTILLSQINEGDRARKDYGNIEGLKNSLSTLGSIHPIVLSKDTDASYSLVAGGRRLRAAGELGVSELHHGSILEPGRIGFLFRDEVPADLLKEAELDENLYRLKPKWQEDVMLVAEVHALKRDKEGHKWGQRQTAELLSEGWNLYSVNWAIRIAKELKAGNKDVEACSNVSDAIATLFKAKEDKALAELSRRTMPQGPVDVSSFLDTINIELVPGTIPEKTPLVEGPQTVVSVPLSTMFRCGDFRTVLPTFPDASFDHIVTDIPYGIDMKNLDTMSNIADVADEHDVAQNVEMMAPFLCESYRLVRSGGFCAFFFDLDWLHHLQTLARDIGWRVQRWPLIAYKTSVCQNNAAQYNFTKNYESIMVLRRDERTVLRSQQATSVWMGDFAVERRLYNNPFAKPFELWKWLYSAVAFNGQSVLDPFCGEMSACRAAANCGLVPYGVEIKEQHYNRGLQNMKAIYATIHGGNVEFQ